MLGRMRPRTALVHRNFATASRTALAICILGLVAAQPAHAVATIAADTTRAQGLDPVAAGRGTTLVAGNGGVTLLRFRVQGLTAPPARAVLRLRVLSVAVLGALTVQSIAPAFGEDDGQPATLAPGAVVATHAGVTAGTWAELDVTAAVTGNGDVGLHVSPQLPLGGASFSSREGADAPQLVVTPDDDRGVRLAGLLDPRAADTFVAAAKDDAGSSLDGLDVIAAPAGGGVPGRYIGVHHTLVGQAFVAKLATSDNLTTWTHRADIDTHATQATLAALPDGGFVLAFERDTPDAQYVSVSNLVVRHYATWAALVAGTPDRDVSLPRTLAPTAEGTPGLEVRYWSGPEASQIAINFHYLRDIKVDRQAAGVLTNFSAAGWTAQPATAPNDLFGVLGTRGNLGDRADLLFESHAFSVLEAQSIKANFGAWRWYLYDRERDEARLLAIPLPAGSYSIGNPTVRALPDPAGNPLLMISGFAFSQGGVPGEAGQFIALRHAATGPQPGPIPAAPPPPPIPQPVPAPITLAVSPQPAPAVRAVAPPPADRTAPAVTLSTGARRLAGRIAFGISCPAERCRAAATGTVRVPRIGRAKARSFTLKVVATTIEQAGRGTLRLSISASARAAIRRALRAGRSIAVKLVVVVGDDAGNTRTLRRQIRLRL
jgi:hypothetical protein